MNLKYLSLAIVLLSSSLACLSERQAAPPPSPTASPATPVPVGDAAPPTPESQQATPPGTAQAPAQAAPPAQSSTTYIIGAEDTLQITVWKEPSFSGSVPVRPDGMISMALVGDLAASGFTPMQLGTDIATRLKKYINDPSVTVTVLSVRPKQVYLLGEVGHVGPLAITQGMTVLQAIAGSGGVTPFAKSKNIYILRGEAGHQKKILFNYKKALKSGDDQGVSLVPGDTIVVP